MFIPRSIDEASEQREALAKVIHLVDAKPPARIEGIALLAANDVVSFPTGPSNDILGSKVARGRIGGSTP